MTADTVGGVWTYVMDLARALDPYGVEVVLATMGAAASADQRAAAQACRNVRLVESEYKLEWMQSPWEDVERAGDWLLELEHRFAPDLVHLNGYVHAALPWSAPVLVVGHSCVRSWFTAVKGSVPTEWDRYTERVRCGLAHADLVVAPTNAMLRALEQHYGPLGEAQVVANGRSLPYTPSGAREHLIVAAGRLWDEAKNVAMLARVAPRLPWPVAIAGDVASPDGAAIELPPRVRSLGRLSSADVARWMGRAGVYALPARYEPFGLSALEAALSGCALVLGDIDSLREVWGDAACFVSPDDDEALVRALRRVCNDNEARTSLAQRARERAAELTPGRMAAQYAAIYGRLSDARTEARMVACAS